MYQDPMLVVVMLPGWRKVGRFVKGKGTLAKKWALLKRELKAIPSVTSVKVCSGNGNAMLRCELKAPYLEQAQIVVKRVMEVVDIYIDCPKTVKYLQLGAHEFENERRIDSGTSEKRHRGNRFIRRGCKAKKRA